MKRLVVFVTVLLAAFAPVAAADKPQKDPLVASDFDYPAFVCGFTVHSSVLAANESLKTFSEGRFLITGTYKARLTNVDNPAKSIDVNASGPGVITFAVDGTVTLRFTGRSLLNFFPGDFGPGSPGMILLTTGPVILTSYPDGRFTYEHSGGTTEDICAALR